MKSTVLIINITDNIQLSDLLSRTFNIIESIGHDNAINDLKNNFQCISVILMDVENSNDEGYQLLSDIRSVDDYIAIPVIVVTNESNSNEKEKYIELGATNIITRPYRGDLLLSHIKSLSVIRERGIISHTLNKDRLTGLLLKTLFFDECDRMIRKHENSYYIISCFDIDNFKVINDQYGMSIGDEVLKHVATCIKECMQNLDGISCRFSADRFAIMYPAKFMNSQVILDCHRKITFPQCINHSIRVRIGRYVINDQSLSSNVMYERATMAEESIKGRYDIYIADYNDSMRSNLLKEQKIVNEMDVALKEGQFITFLQPQYNHASGSLIGAEALVRWKKGNIYISPYEFIPIFEKNGFVYDIDKYMWKQICILLRNWLDENKSPLPVSVNISRFDLYKDDFFSVICNLVEEYKIPADLLRLEVTESAFADSPEQILDMVNKLIEYGFTVEIDDFGSGYSSLNTLKDVPASILKLDMKFFENTRNSVRSGNIIESVVRMAKWLGMAVIAEGVEEKEQADYLQSIGCYYIQGYYYAKPMPVKEYEKLLFTENHEPKLTRLKSISNLDNNEFWNPKSMETLIFNSYVGGACIFEYYHGKTELLRVNEQYAQELGGIMPDNAYITQMSPVNYLDDFNMDILNQMIEDAIKTKKEASCELKLCDNEHEPEFIRFTIRRIASTGERYLFYCVTVNMTAQRTAEHLKKMAELKEMESAQRLQIIMKNINGGVSALLIDDEGNSDFVFTNDKYYELYGYTKEQAIEENLDVMSLIIPEDIDVVMNKVKELKKYRKPLEIDYRCRRKDGEIVYLRANASMMSMKGYGDSVITSVVTDITKQRLLSDQLEAIINNINGGVSVTVLKDKKPKFIVINNRFYEIFGYTKEQYMNECHSVYDFLHPDDKERVIKQFKDNILNKDKYRIEYRIIRKDGVIRYIQSDVKVMRIFGVDEPVQLVVANDITHIREIELNERMAADKMQAVLNYAGNGITAVIMHKESNELIMANDKYYEIIGYNKDSYKSILSHDVYSIIHPQDRNRIRALIYKANQSGKPVTVEYRVIGQNNKIVWVKTNITITHLFGIEDPVQIAIFTDITEEKQANEQLQFLNDSAHDILAQSDVEQAVIKTLQKLTSYFGGERTYVVEIDNVHKVTNNTYEVCAKGVKSEKDNLQDFPYNESDYWYNKMKSNQILYYENIDDLEESDQIKDSLHNQGISSILIAPLKREEKLIGFMGVDNPTKSLSQIDRLLALGDYLAILLTKRDLSHTIEQDNHAITMLMNDTPGGFCRLKITENEPQIEYVNEGFCKLLNMSHDDVINSFRSKSGQIYLNSYFADMSEQIQAEQEQKELLDNLPCGAALYEYDGESLKVIHINKRYWQLVEREPQDYTNNSVYDAIHSDDVELVHQEIEAAIKQNRDIDCDIRIKCGTEYRLFHIMAKVAKNERDNYILYTSYTRINERNTSIQDMIPIALSTMMMVSEENAYIKGKDLRYICCSKSAAKSVGLKNPREILGKTNYDLFDKDLADRMNEEDEKLIRNGKPAIDVVQKIYDKNNNIHLASTSKYPLMDEYGCVVGIYGITRDITQDKKNEKQLEFLTRSIPGGIAAFSFRNGVFTRMFFNEGFYKFSGYSKDEYIKLTSENPLALVIEEDRNKIYKMIGKYKTECRNGEIENCIYRCYTKNGGYKWMNMKCKLSELSDGDYILNVVQIDITEQKKVEENLRVAEEEYRLAAIHSGRTIGRYNIEDKSLRIESPVAQSIGQHEYIKNVPYNQENLKLISPDTADAYIQFFESIINGQKEVDVTFQKLLPDGWRWVNAHATTIFSENNKPVSAIVSYIDITKQYEKETIFRKWKLSMENRNTDSYTLFRCDLSKKNSFESSEGTLIQLNQVSCRNSTFDECVSIYAQKFVYQDDRKVYIDTMNKDNLISDYYQGKCNSILDYREIYEKDVRWIRRKIDLFERPDASGIMAYIMFENIDSEKRKELDIQIQAETDPLTGLLNRNVFAEKMKKVISMQKNDLISAFLLLDMDGFKKINDTFGHAAGDKFLIETGKTIQSAIREEDFVGRLGGDEFIICLSNVAEKEIIENRAAMIWSLLHRTFDDDIQISASIGIAISPDDGEDFNSLYHKADKALYKIKNSGKDNFEFYNE